ncbi:ORF6N domain-containing protein [Chitinophagaceae bacterium 26-R-25]|nr:ORF6N domain-containing protein [Chitinophagaceae bacterium 26-R-25]
MQIIHSIQNKIYEVRGQRIMLDRDLAELYEVEARILNQAVKRNNKRFPEDFMFRITEAEWFDIQLKRTGQSDNSPSRSQFVILNTTRGSNTKYLPYAFTEQGVAMLSSVLRSEKAIEMNIAIMRAFVEIRKVLILQTDLKEQIKQIKERIGEHDAQLSQIYDALENILDEKAAQRKWEERDRIGFKK